jgi:hypothetical protein
VCVCVCVCVCVYTCIRLAGLSVLSVDAGYWGQFSLNPQCPAMSSAPQITLSLEDPWKMEDFWEQMHSYVHYKACDSQSMFKKLLVPWDIPLKWQRFVDKQVWGIYSISLLEICNEYSGLWEFQLTWFNPLFPKWTWEGQHVFLYLILTCILYN